MTDMDRPLPEPIMAPLNNIVEEAADNGNSMKNGAWLPKKLSETQDAIRAYAAAEVAKERERCAALCESRATPGTGSVAILNGAAAAIRAAAPPQCTAPPPEPQ